MVACFLVCLKRLSLAWHRDQLFSKEEISLTELFYVNRSHTVLGRVTLSDRMEDVAMSLEDSPVFICAKEGKIISSDFIQRRYGLRQPLSLCVIECFLYPSIESEINIYIVSF